MTALTDMIASNLAWAIGQMAEPVTYRGTVYHASISGTTRKGAEAVEGLVGMADCEATIAKATLAKAPNIDEPVTVRGRVLHVESVLEDAAGAAWIIGLSGDKK